MGRITTSFEQRVMCSGGTRVIDDATEVTGLTCFAIECVADTAVNVMTGYDENGTAVNFKTAYNLDTLKAGYTYYIKKDNYVDVIDLTSGTINVHNV